MIPAVLPVTRRGALLGLGAAFSLGHASLALAAAPTENRFVVVLLRGAMDGMSAVQPYGDPDCTSVRGDLALAEPNATPGDTTLLDLGGFYGLHPQLANLHAMYKAGDALILHAAAGHYRSRSHSEAQDYLECGADQRLASGWLNRAVAALVDHLVALHSVLAARPTHLHLGVALFVVEDVFGRGNRFDRFLPCVGHGKGSCCCRAGRRRK